MSQSPSLATRIYNLNYKPTRIEQKNERMADQTFLFAASGVSFDPLLPAGLPTMDLDAAPATRPTNSNGLPNHVNHPHGFVHSGSPPKHGHGHAHGQELERHAAPLHSHHPNLVSHNHTALTAHLKSQSREVWKATERKDRDDLVRERRGVHGLAEPRTSQRRASVIIPETTRPQRERRGSLPPGFTFPNLSFSPLLASERDVETLFGLPGHREHPLHATLGRAKTDPAESAKKLFKESRHRAQDLARGLRGVEMDVDEENEGVMGVEFERGDAVGFFGKIRARFFEQSNFVSMTHRPTP